MSGIHLPEIEATTNTAQHVRDVLADEPQAEADTTTADDGAQQEPDDITTTPSESGVSALARELVRVRAEMARMSAENHRLRREVADTIVQVHKRHDREIAGALRKLGDMIVNIDKRLAAFEQQREQKASVSAWV